jgi:hypothetical protein
MHQYLFHELKCNFDFGVLPKQYLNKAYSSEMPILIKYMRHKAKELCLPSNRAQVHILLTIQQAVHDVPYLGLSWGTMLGMDNLCRKITCMFNVTFAMEKS